MTADQLAYEQYIEALVASGSEPDVDDLDYDAEAAYERRRDTQLAS